MTTYELTRHDDHERTLITAAKRQLLALSRHADRRTKCPPFGEEQRPCFLSTRRNRYVLVEIG